jgi:hypothetical protein
MVFARAMDFEATPTRPAHKKNIKVVSEMTTFSLLRELWARHWIMLMTLAFVFENGYIVWDKVLRPLFF